MALPCCSISALSLAQVLEVLSRYLAPFCVSVSIICTTICSTNSASSSPPPPPPARPDTRHKTQKTKTSHQKASLTWVPRQASAQKLHPEQLQEEPTRATQPQIPAPMSRQRLQVQIHSTQMHRCCCVDAMVDATPLPSLLFVAPLWFSMSLGLPLAGLARPPHYPPARTHTTSNKTDYGLVDYETSM